MLNGLFGSACAAGIKTSRIEAEDVVELEVGSRLATIAVLVPTPTEKTIKLFKVQ